MVYLANPASRNNRMLFGLGFGALFSFLGASAAGKNNAIYLHDIYDRGRQEGRTDYQRKVADANDGKKQ